MSDTSKEQVGIIEEVTPGTTPASALASFGYVTGVSGGLERTTERTGSLRANYVRGTTVRTGDAGSLTLNSELAYGDPMLTTVLEGVLRSDWSSPASVTATDISFVASDNSINSIAEDLTVFPVGTWVRVAGTTSNDDLHFVVTSTTAKLTCGTQTTIADESAGTSFTLDNDGYIRNGTVLHPYTVERDFNTTGGSTPFRPQRRLYANSLNIEVPMGFVTCVAGFTGLPPAADAAATAGSGAYTAPTTNEPFTGANNFSTLLEGGAAYAGAINTFSLALSAPIRSKMKLGAIEPFGEGGNSFDFSGSMSAYKDDSSDAVYAQVRNFAARFVAFTLTDTAGNILQITTPQIKYTGGTADNSGNDNDIYQALPFAIDEHPTYGYLIQFDRFAA